MSFSSWRWSIGGVHPCAGAYHDEEEGRIDCDGEPAWEADFLTPLGDMVFHFCERCAKHEKDQESRSEERSFQTGGE